MLKKVVILAKKIKIESILLICCFFVLLYNYLFIDQTVTLLVTRACPFTWCQRTTAMSACYCQQLQSLDLICITKKVY